tara:strand:+ start:2444 stop:2728 length:285 start_codon:yes stop_codon:yes gene_type:complete
MNRDALISKIKTTHPGQFIKTAEEFSPSQFKDSDGIWLSGESGVLDKKGKRIFSYYNDNSSYENGVIRHLNKMVEKQGWYFEWYDAGTIMIFKK